MSGFAQATLRRGGPENPLQGTNDGHHEPKPGDQDTSASDTENTEKENCFT